MLRSDICQVFASCLGIKTPKAGPPSMSAMSPSLTRRLFWLNLTPEYLHNTNAAVCVQLDTCSNCFGGQMQPGVLKVPDSSFIAQVDRCL